jgi:hypothetical protein
MKNKLFLGKPLSFFALVLPCDPAPAIANTASHFVKYIKEATGSDLKTVNSGEKFEYEICIGQTDRDTEKVIEARNSLKYNGIAIVADKTKIYLTGADVLGTVYSMYTFLEDYLGFRFYANDFHLYKNEYSKDFASDLNYTYSPVFEGRDTDWVDVQYGSAKPYGNEFDLEFCNALKINGYYARYQGDYDRFGGSFRFSGNGAAHTIGGLAESDAMQPCLSDENVFQTVLKNVRKILENEPTAKIVDVSMNDNWEFCKCEKCDALDRAEAPPPYVGQPNPMGTMLSFVNRIAREIKKDYPNVYISTLAYMYTKVPPVTIVPEDNVIIRLCNIECCFAHPLSDPDCSHRGGVNAEYINNLKAWSKLAKKLYIWDYTTNFFNYLHSFPNLHVLWDNIRTFKDNNAVAVFEEGNRDSFKAEFAELRAYLLAKLMWNPHMTKDEYYQMMDEYLQDFYGSAWKYVREYIDITSEAARRNHMGIYSSPYEYLRSESGSEEDDKAFVLKLVDLWNKALECADNDIIRKHIRHARTQAEILYLQKYYNEETDVARADELYSDLEEMKAFCLHEWERHLFPTRENFIKGPAHWVKI